MALLSCAVLLFLGVLGIIVFDRRIRKHDAEVHAEIERRLASLRAAGAFLTLADVTKLCPDPPPERDAAILLAPALDQLSVPNRVDGLPLLTEARLPPGTVPLDEHTRTEIQGILEANRPALEAAKQTALSDAWFASGFSGSLTNFTSQPIKPVRQLAQLLCLDAALKAESHRGAEASQSLARALQIKKAIRSPATVWHLSHMVGDKAVCATLERVLNCTELTEPDLSLLATELVYDPPNDLKEVLALELTSELTHIEFWRGMATQMVNKAWTPIDRLSAKYVARRMFRDEEFLAYLEWQDGRFASFRSSTRQQVEWLATNSPPKQRTAKDASMAMLFIATMPNLVTQEAQWLARLRLARTAVAIERWRLAHEGRLPDSLAELAPTFLPVLPADPFDDQLLRFKKLARGYVVYSIGADFTDDSGKKKPEKAKEDDHYDIAFTVER